jgi:hypothetical protein
MERKCGNTTLLPSALARCSPSSLAATRLRLLGLFDFHSLHFSVSSKLKEDPLEAFNCWRTRALVLTRDASDLNKQSHTLIGEKVFSPNVQDAPDILLLGRPRRLLQLLHLLAHSRVQLTRSLDVQLVLAQLPGLVLLRLLEHADFLTQLGLAGLSSCQLLLGYSDTNSGAVSLRGPIVPT